MDARPTLKELCAVAREALPARLPSAPAVRRSLGTVLVRTVALLLGAVALPAVGFLGDGRPPWADVALTAALVGGTGAAWDPLWRRAVGAVRLVPLATTVAVLDAAVLHVVDVLLADRFDTGGGLELLAAAVALAVPTAVLAVVRDVLATPDPAALPD